MSLTAPPVSPSSLTAPPVSVRIRIGGAIRDNLFPRHVCHNVYIGLQSPRASLADEPEPEKRDHADRIF